jgi:uncharacterized protein YqfA (UPF0365 family)
MIAGMNFSICAWPLGEIKLEGGSIIVGPSLDALVALIFISIIALFVLPAVGFIALLVSLLTFLLVPRWICASQDLRADYAFVLGALQGYRLRNVVNSSSIAVWLPAHSRLKALLSGAGITVEANE